MKPLRRNSRQSTLRLSLNRHNHHSLLLNETRVNLREPAYIDSFLTFAQNTISLNSASLSMLNLPAHLTFKNITASTPKIMKDGIECSTCSILSYAGNTLSVSVPGFSTYVITEGQSDPTPPPPSSGGGGGGSSGGSSGGGTVSDTTAPPEVTNLSATPGATAITLSWVNPPADIGGFTGIRITRGTTTAPSAEQYTLIYEGTDQTRTSFTDTTVSSNIPYVYRVRTKDAAGNYSNGALVGSTAGVPATPVTTPTPESSACTPTQTIRFSAPLHPGIRHAEVRALQVFLNANGYLITTTGDGSPGKETDYYGTLTKAAIARFQVAKGILPTTAHPDAGLVGPRTRAALNGGSSCAPATPTTGSTGSPQASVTFTRALKQGDRGEDVRQLQTFLIAQGHLAAGNDSGFFGALTKAALIRFQEAHAGDILTPNNLTKGTGFFGQATRAKVHLLMNASALTSIPTTDNLEPEALRLQIEALIEQVRLMQEQIQTASSATLYSSCVFALPSLLPYSFSFPARYPRRLVQLKLALS